jgi:hypothetical protein
VGLHDLLRESFIVVSVFVSSVLRPRGKTTIFVSMSQLSTPIFPLRLACILALAASLSVPAAFAGNWPNWRGPNLNGTTADANNLPESWGVDHNVRWKLELPAWSGSTPVIWEDKVFILSPSKQQAPQEAGGRAAVDGPGGQEILLFCISRKNGDVLWKREVDTGNWIKMKHNSSSPSPVTDGSHVWAVSGEGAMVAFDMDGN